MLLAAGCFGPEPREGLRCSADGDCPPGQDCFPGGPGAGVCSSAPPADASADVDGGGPIAFGAPDEVPFMCGEAPCLSPRDPSLTGDRKQIAFTVETMNADGDLDVYLAIRPTAFDSWFPAAQAGAIDSLLVEEGSSLSANGLRLYFTREDQNLGGPPYGELWVSDRVAEGDPFDNAAPVAGVVNTSQGNERSAVQTADAARLILAAIESQASATSDAEGKFAIADSPYVGRHGCIHTAASFATWNSMYSMPLSAQACFSSSSIGREAFETSVSPRQKRSKPPPVPETPTVT